MDTLWGLGTMLNIYLYGNEESDLRLAVNRDGQLVMPQLGPINVSGLTFKQVRERSRRRKGCLSIGWHKMVVA